MSTFLKVFCGIFILIGLAISVREAREIARTMNMVEHVKGVFIGYETRVVTSKTSKDKSVTVDYYPQFEFTTKDGVKHEVAECLALHPIRSGEIVRIHIT